MPQVKENLNQENLCNKSDGCKQANEGQQITGKDNVVWGFNDQSENLNSETIPLSTGTNGTTDTPGSSSPPGPQA